MSAEQRDGLRPPLDTLRKATKAYFDHEITLQQFQEIKWGPVADASLGLLNRERTYPVVEAADQSLKTEVSLEATAGSGEIGKMTLFEKIKKPIIDVFVARRRG